MLIELKTDALNICERLKEIDKSYYLVFNTIKGKYEVHSYSQKGCSYCLTYPHSGLDERLVMLTKKTRRENLSQLIKEIEEENLKIEKQNQKKIMEEL